MIELLLPYELNLGGHMLSRLPFGFGNQGSGIDQLLGISALGTGNSDGLLHNTAEALSRADLLIGIVISAVLVALTIQVRRWRDVA